MATMVPAGGCQTSEMLYWHRHWKVREGLGESWVSELLSLIFHRHGDAQLVGKSGLETLNLSHGPQM